MVDAMQPTETPEASASAAPPPDAGISISTAAPTDAVPLLAPQEANIPTAPTQKPAPVSYQDQISKLQKAGFSGDEIQSYSVNQAVKLRQAGFSQDEVDSYQGMKPPAVPGGTPIYGHIPTDKDFQNAASVILGGNDHPFYEKAVDTLKNLFTDTGVHPTDAVKIASGSTFHQNK